MLLAHHRRLLRAEAIAMLWPDKNEKSGQNNLRTALSHLRTLLEADELPGNLPWHVRSLDDLIVLHRSDRLVVDAELFTQHLDRARAADRARRPSDALAAYLEAVDLVRGDYAADVSTGDWAAHARLRFTLAEVEACTRASELLTAGTAMPRPAVDAAPVVEPLTLAIELADRAVRREPLSERAHRALIRARSATGDRAGALRCHQRVLELIDGEDLRPEPETVRLVAEL
jgi:DNA-binding SARP family transcriptional activator